MKKLMQYLMLSCYKATALMEKKNNGNTSFINNIQILMHTSVCNACKEYEKQSRVIENTLKKHLHSSLKSTLVNDPLKTKIISSLPKE